ncbi:MAG: hypothetical protein ACK4JD_13260, partial [Thermoflexales bacterium]
MQSQSTSDSKVCVLIDAHMLGHQETGNETYVLNLLRQWVTFADVGIELRGAIPKRYTTEPSWAFRAVHLAHESDLHRLVRGLPKLARRSSADLLHVTYHAPFWSRHPYVVTIHDASYRTHWRHHRPRNVLIQNVLGAFSAWRARA